MLRPHEGGERGVEVREAGDAVWLGDALEQRRVGVSRLDRRAAGALETTQMPLADAGAADDEVGGFHGWFKVQCACRSTAFDGVFICSYQTVNKEPSASSTVLG